MKKRMFSVLLSALFLFSSCSQLLPNNSASSLDSSSQSSFFEDSSSVDSSWEDSSFADSSSADSSFADSSLEDSSSSMGDIDGDCTHVDSNNDDICDTCYTTVAVTIQIGSINDLHGKFADTDAQPGVDELSTWIKNVYAEYPSVLLSSGDMWQGSPESNLTKGAIINDWMNEMDFVAMTMGNHEYDWGQEYILANAEAAEFPYLGINIYDTTTNQRVEYCQPSVMVERGGAKIGIIGAIGDCLSSISGEQSEGLMFKTGAELTKLVKAESEKLRAEGADFIIYSLHDGYGSSYSSPQTLGDSSFSSYYDVALSDGYVDFVFEGHSHQKYVLKDSKGVYHLQGGGDNDGIVGAEVKINYVNDTFEVNDVGFVANNEYTHLEGDPIVETLLEKYAEQISVASRVLGKNDRLRDSDEILETCAALYCEVGLKEWGEEYDIVLGGGFMSARSPYQISAGMVTYGDLQNVLPFDNQLVLCSISGSKLKSQFLETSNSRYYVSVSEYGQSIRNSIKNSGTYYIVTDTYSSTYAPNGCTEIARYDASTFARDLLAAYIEAGNWTSNEPLTLTSIPQIYEIGNALANNGETSEEYYVKGKIISITGTSYGNMTIEDEYGNTLYIYGLYDGSGNRYDKINNPPVVGDTIIVRAPIKKYVYGSTVTIELFYADWVETVTA